MGEKNPTGVCKKKRGDKIRLVIDFRFTNKDGKRDRFRRDASVQMWSAAVNEAKRLMQRAAETGCPEEDGLATSTTTLPAKTTFKVFVDGTFEEQFMPTFRPATIERYRALLGQRIMAFFGELPIDEIELPHIRAFAAKTAQDGVMLKGPVTLVRTILRTAFEAELRGAPPVLPRGFIKTSKKVPDAPSADEVTEMLKVTGWLSLAVPLAGLAGLRMGEVRALEVRDVDFAGHRLLVRRAMSGTKSLTPKSNDERVVPMVPLLEERLREAVHRMPQKARIVVLNDGRTPERTHVLSSFKRFQRNAGLKVWSFHSLRHHFITELVRSGASLEAVRMLAGHATLAMTQRYAHATAADLTAAVQKLGR